MTLLDDEDAPPESAPARLAGVRAVLSRADAAFAKFSCDGTAECCQLATTQKEPYLWPAEWEFLQAALAGRQRPAPRPDGGCPLLDAAGKRCTTYADRPLGCRTYFCHRVKGPARQPLELMDALGKELCQLSYAHEDFPRARPLRELLAKLPP